MGNKVQVDRAKIRRRRILRVLHKQGPCTAQAVLSYLRGQTRHDKLPQIDPEVSNTTILRDFQALQKDGYATAVRGRHAASGTIMHITFAIITDKGRRLAKTKKIYG